LRIEVLNPCDDGDD
jgi:hypothetical protein